MTRFLILTLTFLLYLMPSNMPGQVWMRDTTLLTPESTLEELRDRLAAHTKELSPDLGNKRLPAEEVQSALTAFKTAKEILSKNITEEFRIWTLKREAAALITLAYERTPEFYPELVGIVEKLDGLDGCETMMTEAERHVLIIGVQLRSIEVRSWRSFQLQPKRLTTRKMNLESRRLGQRRAFAKVRRLPQWPPAHPLSEYREY